MTPINLKAIATKQRQYTKLFSNALGAVAKLPASDAAKETLAAEINEQYKVAQQEILQAGLVYDMAAETGVD